MARTMETKTLTVPNVPILFSRGEKIYLQVNDHKDSARTILLEFSVEQAQFISTELSERAERLLETVKQNSLRTKLAKLQAIIDDSSLPESLRLECASQLEALSV